MTHEYNNIKGTYAEQFFSPLDTPGMMYSNE
jgi:hypothetical protein